MDNLQWRQHQATPGTDGTMEVVSPIGQQKADQLEGSKYTKWIYQVLHAAWRCCMLPGVLPGGGGAAGWLPNIAAVVCCQTLLPGGGTLVVV